MNEWIKLPGLFHRSEFEEVVEVDGEHEYRFDPAGRDSQGLELVAIFCRVRRRHGGGALVELPRRPELPAREGGVA